MQNEGATLSFQEELFIFILIIFGFASLVRVAFPPARNKATSRFVFWGSILTIFANYCYFLFVDYNSLAFSPDYMVFGVIIYCFCLMLGTVFLYFSIRSRENYYFLFELVYMIFLFFQINWLYILLET